MGKNNCCILIAWIVLLCFGCQPVESTSVTFLPVYQDLKEEYLLLNRKYGEQPVTVFAGDSIIKRFNLAELSDSLILNRGIFHDTTHGLLNRIEENFNNLHLGKLFLMIGYNDLKYRNDDEIIGNISKILSSVKADEIFLFSLLPVADDRPKTNHRIRWINKALERLSRSSGVEFIDVYAIFLNDDHTGISRKLSRDGVHPNFQGYTRWYEFIKPYL